MNVDDVEDRELRQLLRLRLVIQEFRRAAIPLGRLVSEAEALVNELERTDPSIRRSMEQEWWKLEQEHAVALARGDVPDEARVRSYVDALAALVEGQIGAFEEPH